MGDQLYDELLVELECPVCTNYMSPPIRQCTTGHSICEDCRKKLAECPLCKTKFTDSRNISLEGLAVKMRYPCMNKPAGCTANLSYTERETHELRCPLQCYRCAMDKCAWAGRLEDLVGHWASKKMCSKPYHKNSVCHTKMKAESYYVNMVNAHNKLFWFKCKIINSKMFWAVQYIGPAKDADNYSYEIEIFKPGRAKKKIVMSDYCQSIDVDNGRLFNDDGCISINTDAINGFVSADQILIYYLRVNASETSEEAGNQVPAKQDAPFWKHRDRSKGPPIHGNKNFKKKFSYPQQNNSQHKPKNDEFVLL